MIINTKVSTVTEGQSAASVQLRFRRGSKEAEAAHRREVEALWQCRGRAMENPILNAALDLLLEDFAILALIPRGKAPLAKGLKNPITTASAAVAHWQREPAANLAVLTGARFGLVVVDLDGPGGDSWWDSFNREHGPIRTRTARTGRADGGSHLYFRVPGGCRLKGGNGVPAVGVDLKADGGYVVVPPSIHSTGRSYEWIDDGPVAELPTPLLQLLRERGREHQRSLSRPSKAATTSTQVDPLDSYTDVETTPYGRQAMRDICEELARCSPGGGRMGGRDNLANWSYVRAGKLVASGHVNSSEALAALSEAMELNGLGSRNAKVVAFSDGLLKGMSEPIVPTARAIWVLAGAPGTSTTALSSDVSDLPVTGFASDSAISDTQPPGLPSVARSSPTPRLRSPLARRLRSEVIWCPQPRFVMRRLAAVVEGARVPCGAVDCRECQRRQLAVLAEHIAGYVDDHPGGELQRGSGPRSRWNTFARSLNRASAQYVHVPVAQDDVALIWAPKVLAGAERLETLDEFELHLEAAWWSNRDGSQRRRIDKSQAWRPPVTKGDFSEWEHLGVFYTSQATRFLASVQDAAGIVVGGVSCGRFSVEFREGSATDSLGRWFPRA